MESSDRASNPKRYWSLLRKLCGKMSNPQPNISIISFDGKTHSSPKAIAQAFNRQFTVSSAQQEWIPHTGRLKREASQRLLGRRGPPRPRGLMGLPCSTPSQFPSSRMPLKMTGRALGSSPLISRPLRV